MEFTGFVRVQPGNTVNISFGEDALHSRWLGWQIAQALIKIDAKGFDPASNMRLVIPQVPFKPNSKERYEDGGLHTTAVLQGRAPWVAEDGTPDVVTSDMEKFAGQQMQLSIDPNNWHFLEGSPQNDEGTGLVFYLAAFLDPPSRRRVGKFRQELGVGPTLAALHISLAGVAPADGDFAAFRKRFCRPRPPAGTFPGPYLQLTSQTADPIRQWWLPQSWLPKPWLPQSWLPQHTVLVATVLVAAVLWRSNILGWP